MCIYRSAFFCNSPKQIERVYGSGRREQLMELTALYPQVVTAENINDHIAKIRDIDVVFSTWGMFVPEDRHFAELGSLKAVFYGAGSVKSFAEPFLERGIKVISAWAANAVPVAEFTLAQILLSCKRYFLNQQACKDPERRDHGPRPCGHGAFNEKVAIIGAGMVGRKVIELLSPFNLEILVVDPFLEKEFCAREPVTRVALEEAFAEAYVISNHLPNIAETVGLLDKALFASMREGATFINTGRGAQVNEGDLIQICRQRPDITFLLDVTSPEPPEKTSPFYQLPNVFLSSHIAGSLGNEVVRMADYVIREFKLWQGGMPLNYEIDKDKLKIMA